MTHVDVTIHTHTHTHKTTHNDTSVIKTQGSNHPGEWRTKLNIQLSAPDQVVNNTLLVIDFTLKED